jgi:predicted metal-dependent hydrolase
MKITISQNIDNIGFAIETNRDEIGGVDKLKELANKFQSKMTRAYEAAQMVFKEFPEFKQVTLDTMTDEERKMIELSEHSNNQN